MSSSACWLAVFGELAGGDRALGGHVGFALLPSCPRNGGGWRWKAEKVAPHLVEPRERLIWRRHGEPLAVAFEEAKALQLGERILDFEVDIDDKRLIQPQLDLAFQLGLSRRGPLRVQAII